jgi:hypothetical protein
VKAGRNTPQSVLRYIDTILDRSKPVDPLEVAKDLGYGPTRIRKLKEKHGDKLLPHLLKEKRRRQEEPRFMAKQNGMLHPPQYVSTVHGAIDDAEAPPHDVTEEYARRGWETVELLKGEELAKRQARSRAERLRQAELELRRRGKSADEYARAVDEAIDAMRREAKAA